MVREDLYSLVYNEIANRDDVTNDVVSNEKYQKQGFTRDEVSDVFDYMLEEGVVTGFIDYQSNLEVTEFYG